MIENNAFWGSVKKNAMGACPAMATHLTVSKSIWQAN
jgi:hypothetical protein